MIALSTGSLYSYDISRVFELAKDAGFEGIEIMVDRRWDSRQPDYLNRLSRQYSLPIVSVHSPFVMDIPGWPEGGSQRLSLTVALAQAVGARLVVTHLPARVTYISIASPVLWKGTRFLRLPYTWDKESLRGFTDNHHQESEQSGVTIAVENLPYRPHFFGLWRTGFHRNTPDDWAKLPHWVMDTTHLGTGRFDVLAIYERLKGRLAHIHLSNYNGKEHRLLSDGHLPLAELLRRLRRDAYQGAIVVELDPDSLGAADESAVRANLRAGYAFCHENY